MLEPLYAVRRIEDEDVTGYAVLPEPSTTPYRDELREQVACNEDIEAGWCLRPLTLPRSQAEALARHLAAKHGQAWEAAATHRPCPACGRDIWADDGDFLYPLKRDHSKWRAGCNEHDFGCGFEVEGVSREDVFQQWQTATPEPREPAGISEEQRRIDPRLPLVPPTPVQAKQAPGSAGH